VSQYSNLGLFVKPPPEASHQFPKVLQCLECEAVHLVCVLAQSECQELEPESVWENKQLNRNILAILMLWQCQPMSGAVPFTQR
jgi:hypothetical protein